MNTQTHSYNSTKPLKDRYVRTVSGRKVHIFDPQPEEIDIRDIAHGLSQICRFVGQTSYFYSVAEHSIIIAYSIPLGYPNSLRLEALLHDASEAYLGDVSRPLKYGLPDYREVEIQMERAIAAKFNLSFPTPPIVKELDQIMMEREIHMFFGDKHFNEDFQRSYQWNQRVSMIPMGINQAEAQERFLCLFEELSK